MKLNYKRTILVGFAFFLISAFWQAYDATIPVILTNKFGMSQAWSGVIMALDNILAVFMLPIFGALSDKCNTTYGKRTPFITIGTVIATAALLCLSFVDNAQLKNISAVSAIDNPAALEIIYDTQADAQLLTPEGDTVVLRDKFTKEEFSAIRCKITDPKNGKTITNPDYTNYVAPARQAYAAQRTSENSAPLVLFIILLLIVLLAMATFRSPAVARCDHEAAAQQGKCDHQPYGNCRRHSGAGAGYGIFHLRCSERLNELHLLLRRDRCHHAGRSGYFPLHGP